MSEGEALFFTPEDLQSMLLSYWMAEPPISVAQAKAVLQVIIAEAQKKAANRHSAINRLTHG